MTAAVFSYWGVAWVSWSREHVDRWDTDMLPPERRKHDGYGACCRWGVVGMMDGIG